MASSESSDGCRDGDKHCNSEASEDTENDILDEDNVFEVEKIVGMSKIDGKIMYRVRWLGYSPQWDTWEPYENLLTCKDLVEEYLSRDQKKKKKSPSDRGKRKTSEKRKDSSKETSPVPEGSPKQNKDTFWKDFEEGRIDVFEEDMYSKVKGRSSRLHSNSEDSNSGMQQVPKGKSKTKESNVKERAISPGSSKGKRSPSSKEKSKKRVAKPSTSSDESEDAQSVEVPRLARSKSHITTNTAQEFMETEQTEPLSEIQPMEVDQENEREKITGSTVSSQKSTKLPEVSHSSEIIAKPSSEEPKKMIKQTEEKAILKKESEDSVNNNTGGKNSNIQGKPGQFQFDFSEYDPEEWAKKEAYEISDVIELTNAQFRHAVKCGDFETLRRALNGNNVYNLEQADANGTTLLMVAAMSGYDDIVELLVVNGANINATRRNGTTSLMLACDVGHLCIVAVLLGLGAHMDIQQASGETALIKASRKGHRQIVQLLLEHGANFAITGNNDVTALKYAKMLAHPDIECLLVDHISRVTAAFESQVNTTLNNTARILHALFPIHCFSLNEGTSFKINFNHQQQQLQPGVGMLLFIAHARITPQEIKCRFYGPCAVLSVLLNGVKQPSLTEDANFVLSFSPLQQGKNDLVINSVPAVMSKAKLIVCAYKAQLTGNNKFS